MNKVARPREQVGGVFALETIDKTNKNKETAKRQNIDNKMYVNNIYNSIIRIHLIGRSFCMTSLYLLWCLVWFWIFILYLYFQVFALLVSFHLTETIFTEQIVLTVKFMLTIEKT